LFSFGYHRAEIIGALCSVIVIWVLTIWLVIEAYDRIKNLDKLKIDARIMLITSILGLLANLVMGKVLHSHGSHGHSHAGGGHGHSHGGDHSHSLNDRKSHHSHNERKSQQKSLNNNHAHSHDNN
jgi:zinc transporter 2